MSIYHIKLQENSYILLSRGVCLSHSNVGGFFAVDTGARTLDMTHCAEHVMHYLPTFAMYSGARGVRLCRALVESSRITLQM